MTEKQLIIMQQLIKAAEVDCNFLTVQELVEVRRVVETELYKLRINDFKTFLDNMMQEVDSKNNWDKFYDASWRVTFAGQTLTLRNEAAVFNSMVSLLQELIDHNL